MKDDNIKQFFQSHKQSIADEGFSERLFSALDCLPQPRLAKSRRGTIITSVFGLIGFLIFAAVGGYSAMIEGLVAFQDAVFDRSLITPQIIISVLFIGCSLFAVGKFAVDWE